mgnify:CR=1 FL=1
MIKEAIILAGGFGTRLREVVDDVPKPIAPIAGQPFLNYVFRYLKSNNLNKAILSTGYQGDKISDLYQKESHGLALSYAREEEPLGTGGAIKFAMESCDSDSILVLNGDTFFDVDLSKLAEFHANQKADISMVLRSIDSPDRYGTVSLSGDRITQFNEKQAGLKNGLINGGVYLINRRVWEKVPPLPDRFSIETEFFAPYINELHIAGMISDGYFIDIGIPSDYYQANDDFVSFKY